MRAFATLMDRLAFTPGRKEKLRAISLYLDRAPDRAPNRTVQPAAAPFSRVRRG